MEILGNDNSDQHETCLEDPTNIENNCTKLESAIPYSATKQEDEPPMLVAKDLAGIQVWKRNCNPTLWDEENALIVPQRYVNKVFSGIWEFFNFLIYLSTPMVPSKKRKHSALAPFEESKGEEMSSSQVSSQQ